MHVFEVGQRVYIMFAHQTGKGCAMGSPVVQPQVICLFLVNAEGIHHPGSHADLNQIKESRLRRVQRVVEVKDPGVDMRKGITWHTDEVACVTTCDKATLAQSAPGSNVI